MPGNGRPMLPGRIGSDRVVGDHDRAGLGLPPVVVERQADRASAPDDGLGVQRLADRHRVAQAREVVASSATSSPAFISRRIAVGAVYQTVTLCFWMTSYHLLAEKPPS